MARTQTKGFTLVEMVLVIIILGIVSVGVTSFVTYSTRIYSDTVGVTQVLSDSRFAMERITRELRGATPNSVRVSSFPNEHALNAPISQCIEFMPIEAATSYLDLPIYPEKSPQAEVFIPSQTIQGKHNKVLVYPITEQDIYQGYQGELTHHWFPLKANTTDNNKMLLQFESPVSFTEASPQQRLFIVKKPVSYCFIQQNNSVNLYRYGNYKLQARQPAPNQMSNSALMAEHITNNLIVDKPIHFEPATLMNNAMVVLTPEFKTMDTKFKYQQQIQVINAP